MIEQSEINEKIDGILQKIDEIFRVVNALTGRVDELEKDDD